MAHLQKSQELSSASRGSIATGELISEAAEELKLEVKTTSTLTKASLKRLVSSLTESAEACKVRCCKGCLD